MPEREITYDLPQGATISQDHREKLEAMGIVISSESSIRLIFPKGWTCKTSGCRGFAFYDGNPVLRFFFIRDCNTFAFT